MHRALCTWDTNMAAPMHSYAFGWPTLWVSLRYTRKFVSNQHHIIGGRQVKLRNDDVGFIIERTQGITAAKRTPNVNWTRWRRINAALSTHRRRAKNR